MTKYSQAFKFTCLFPASFSLYFTGVSALLNFPSVEKFILFTDLLDKGSPATTFLISERNYHVFFFFFIRDTSLEVMQEWKSPDFLPVMFASNEQDHISKNDRSKWNSINLRSPKHTPNPKYWLTDIFENVDVDFSAVRTTQIKQRKVKTIFTYL